MTNTAKELYATLQYNRQRHGNAWRKVRRDRIDKLVTVHPDVVELVLQELLDAGLIEETVIQLEDRDHEMDAPQYAYAGNHVYACFPAVKLVTFHYRPR